MPATPPNSPSEQAAMSRRSFLRTSAVLTSGLAALPEYHGLFRKISRNPFLISDGLKIDPDSVSLDELRQLAWRVIGPSWRSQ